MPQTDSPTPQGHPPTPASHLFIAGCPRSGTSALAFLLNEHPHVALGFERYKRVRAQLDPFHFTPAQFFAPVLAETDIRGELLYARLRARWERGRVRVSGDKVPLYTRVLPQLLARFPQARVAVLVRDPLAVARSFRRRAEDPEDWWPAENDHRLAVKMWNEALAAVYAVAEERTGEGKEKAPTGGAERAALLPYEALFSGEERWLELLLDFAGLQASTRVLAEYHRLAESWSARTAGLRTAGLRTAGSQPAGEAEAELVDYVQAHVDTELRAWAQQRMERQLAHRPAVQPMADGEDEPPLSPAQESEREREREQLLQEMRRPGGRAEDEVEVLERRFVEQAGELARRGERLRERTRPGELAAELGHGGRACGPGGKARPRVTFIVPHQRPTTGGVYVIEQFARHLADTAHVCVAVRERPSREIPGVEVRWLEDSYGESLPEADVLVYPADLRDAADLFELLARVGSPVMLFQGYGTPGSPVVQANLSSAREAVAIARWLQDVALAQGVPCTYVPQGLDREVFAPGSVPPVERPPRVSLMTHRLDWKGLDDALEALAIVREQRTDVELALFGTEPVAGEGTFRAGPARSAVEGTFLAGSTGPPAEVTFLPSPTRPEVAALLRESAVHVVASWEEGFGLTGAEAIACGAALASTDTKGSRDYAIDGHTALVSSPCDPQALAENVLALLADAQLRERLVANGQRHLRTAMPPWAEVARRMALALLEG
jgi:glycosyltransferase involved in cell wall biosynthesis